jgi:ABC-type nickel/cobalt efflux system permease component RcnA
MVGGCSTRLDCFTNNGTCSDAEDVLFVVGCVLLWGLCCWISWQHCLQGSLHKHKAQETFPASGQDNRQRIQWLTSTGSCSTEHQFD